MADQIDSVSGGGNGFTLASFTTDQVNFNVPSSGSFDVYIADTYIATSSQPDGLYERTLAQIQSLDATSPASIGFVYPSTGLDPGGAYTSEFSVTWTTNTGGTGGTYVRSSNVDFYIQQWWEREVRPELEAINTTLEAILEQMTPTAVLTGEAQAAVLADQFANIREQLTPTAVLTGEAQAAVLADQLTRIREQFTPITEEAQGEVLADQIARLRYLGDPDATEVDNDENHGTGIRNGSTYNTIQSALLYEAFISNGRILSIDNGSSIYATDSTNQQINDKFQSPLTVDGVLNNISVWNTPSFTLPDLDENGEQKRDPETGNLLTKIVDGPKYKNGVNYVEEEAQARLDALIAEMRSKAAFVRWK
jgi:hypothetical protein